MYEEWLAGRGLREIRDRMADLGVSELWIKRLSDRQDNTKNQIYLGGDITDVPLPMGPFEASQSASGKDSKSRTKYIAPLSFAWITPSGNSPAAQAKVIYYPQYPEVRFSGFTRGALDAPRFLLDRVTQTPGRMLVLGTDGKITYGIALPAVAPAARELLHEFENPGARMIGPLLQLPVEPSTGKGLLLSEDGLMAELHAAWLKSPVPGCRVDRNGTVVSFTGRPAGGATLETILGVRANSDVGPDFHGWELKSFAGREITLMTPSPKGGFLAEHGFEAFMREFGYWNTPKQRYEYTGKQRVGSVPGGRATTRLVMYGYQDGIRDANGELAIVDARGRVGGTWPFAELLDHWRKKHANAVYVPTRRVADAFVYGPNVVVASGTDFATFMARLADGTIAFDPGCHLQPASAGLPSERKARYQWRVAFAKIGTLYDQVQLRDVRKVPADDRLSMADCRRLGLELPVGAISLI